MFTAKYNYNPNTRCGTRIISAIRRVFTNGWKGRTQEFRRRDADGGDRDGRAPKKSLMIGVDMLV
jgi:hypothetical protein